MATRKDVAKAIAPTAYIKPFAFQYRGVRELSDKAGILSTEPVPRPERQGTPFFPRAAVEFLLYMLDNVVSVIGRDEMIWSETGARIAPARRARVKHHPRAPVREPVPACEAITHLSRRRSKPAAGVTPPLEATIDWVH